MKRPYLSFLHCIIALLACCTGLFANAENLYFKNDGHVIKDGVTIIDWDARIVVPEYNTFLGFNFVNADYRQQVESARGYIITKNEDGTELFRHDVKTFSPTDTKTSDWGSYHQDYQPGKYQDEIHFEVTLKDNTTEDFNAWTFNYEVTDATKQAPTIAISVPSYKFKNFETVTSTLTLNYQNPDGVAIKGIRVGAVGAPAAAVEGKTYRHDWNKTDDGQGDIVWGDIMLPADQATGEHQISFDLTQLPATTGNIAVYYKAYIIPEDGANIEADMIASNVSTILPDELFDATATLEINNHSENTNSLAFTVTVNNPSNFVIEAINVWAENGNVRYSQVTSTTAPFAGTLTINDIPAGERRNYWIKAEVLFKNGKKIGGNGNSNPKVEGTDVERYFTGPAEDENFVKTIDSEAYTESPYTNGISYTAANIDETTNTVLWTFPDWAEGMNKNQGISGRYTIVESTDGNYYAPTITYTISNDDYGYIHATLNIPEENLPAGFNPEFILNNNQTAGATRLESKGNGVWKFKSLYAYPNNRTISYFHRAAWQGGKYQTRSFGYKVENVSNEKSEPYTLTTMAEEVFGEGKVSGQIYLCHAHDAWSSVEDNEKYEGYWMETRRPNDYANLNTGQFHFSPAFDYIIANDATNPGKIFVAVKFVEDINTVIPSSFVPAIRIYDADKEGTVEQGTPARSNKAFLPDSDITEELNMEQVPGMVNTYRATTNKEYAPDKKVAVGFKYMYTSIISGSGHSITAPRYYVMSSDDKVVTGIEEVGAGQEAVPALSTVYNLQGVAVRVNVATETALEGLPAGIYIVNGRKWSVR